MLPVFLAGVTMLEARASPVQYTVDNATAVLILQAANATNANLATTTSHTAEVIVVNA